LDQVVSAKSVSTQLGHSVLTVLTGTANVSEETEASPLLIGLSCPYRTRRNKSYTGPNPATAAPMNGRATTQSRTPVTPRGLAMLMAAVVARPAQINSNPIINRQWGRSPCVSSPRRERTRWAARATKRRYREAFQVQCRRATKPRSSPR